MAEKMYRSPQGSRTGFASRNEKRNDFVANAESELSLSYSSSSSSYLDISREYPISPKKGLIRTFFTAPSERRRLRRQKSRRILPLNNSSSSSINTDLAYGTGFLKIKKRRHRKSRIRRDKGKQKSGDTDAALLALGAGLAAVARKQNNEDSKASRRTEIFNSSGRRLRSSSDVRTGNDSLRATRDHDQIIVDEEDWESASGADSEVSSNVDSTLAFGNDYSQPRGKSTVVDPGLFGPGNSLRGHVTEPVGFEYVDPNTVGVLSPADLKSEYYEDKRYEERRFTEKNGEQNKVNTRQPLQTVFPIPTNDPNIFEVTRGAVVSPQEPIVVRPGPVPLQQPQPRTPLSHTIYDQAAELNSPTEKRSSSYGKSIAGAALAGLAGAAVVGSMIANDRSNDRKSGDVSDHEDRRKGKSRDSDGSERRSKRSDKDDVRSHRSSKRESRDGKVDREGKRNSKIGDSPDDNRREKRREKRRDSEREEDPEERRARRREERRAERSKVDSIDERYSGVIEPTTVREPVDPFQFQVDEDAFPTPDGSKETEAPFSRRGRDPSPVVYTVEREPDFSAMRSPTSKDQVYNLPKLDRGTSYHKDDYYRDDRNVQDNREPQDVESTHRESHHSTDAAVGAAFAAQVAAAAAAGALRGSRSSKRREERRGGRNYYGDKDPAVEFEDDQDRMIQEDADRAYRESVIARKAASRVIRERSPSPDAVDKYRRSSRDEAEEVQIVTPPAMDGKKQPGPYDAPNADLELDRVMDPIEFKVFRAPQITPSSPAIDSYHSPTGLDYDNSRSGAAVDRRPLLTLVRPTPSPSPAPLKKFASPDPSSDDQRTQRSTSQTIDDFVIDNKGNAKKTPTPSTPTFSKAVTWGPNETKHYEVESYGETKDEFISSPPREKSKSVPEQPREKSGGWGIVAGAIMGTAAGVSVAKSDASYSSKTKPRNDKQGSEYRGVSKEPEDYRVGSRQSPPATGPKPTGTSMPGSFADDIDFTATLAAGLQDSGFDPNIVIDDPSYRKRMSPPGSDEDFGTSYRKPFAETVSDLGETSSRLSQENRVPVEKQFATEPHVQKVTAENSDFRHESISKLSKKEQKKLDRDSRLQNVDTGRFTDELPASDVIVQEPESYAEHPNSSKKEQKAARKQDRVLDQPIPRQEISPTKEVVPDPEDYFEPTKKPKSKKSKRNSGKYDEKTETTQKDINPQVSVPIDAFDDIINAHAGTPNVTDDWDTLSKSSKRELKRDSNRLDSPSLARTKINADVPFGQDEAEPDPSALPLPMSTISDPEPADFPLPMSTTSQGSRDEYVDERNVSGSFRDSGIFDPSSDRDSQSLARTGASKCDEEEPRKSKKKSRSSHRYDDDDTKSVASAPAYDYESGKTAKKKSRSSSRYDEDDARSTASAPNYDLDGSKKSKKGSFLGLFGISSGKSEPEKRRDESPKAAVDDLGEPKRKKKSKRSSLADSSELYDPDVGSSRNSNDHRERDDDNEDLHSSRRRHRSRDEKRKSTQDEKDSFLARAGTLGAGVGLAGAAMAYAAQHLQSEATTTNPDGADISLDTSFPPGERKSVDSEISHRPFRPSIDPQYGDLLPLPPSDPSSPEIGPHLDNLPRLPDSRPETPESERRISRERNLHLARRAENQPLKSPSQSAIPLRFMLNNRSTPASPESNRSSVVGQTTGAILEPMITPRARPRPTSWDSTKEFKPLYLVQHNRHVSSGGHTASEDQPLAPKTLERDSAPSSKYVQNAASDNPELAGVSNAIAITSANVVAPSEGQKDVPIGQSGTSLNKPFAFDEPSPIEATSKTRSSYLLQDTPPSKKHISRLASGEDSPNPMERDEPFDVSAARNKAFDALTESQANDLSIPSASQEVASSYHYSAIPERNTSVQQSNVALAEPEAVNENAITMPERDIEDRGKDRASVPDSSDPIEFVASEFELQSANDASAGPRTENDSVAAGLEDVIATQPPLVSKELAQFPSASSIKDETQFISTAPLDESDKSNDEQKSPQIHDQPEIQTQEENKIPPGKDDHLPFPISKPKGGKKKKGSSIHAWEFEDPPTSIPISSVDEPEPAPEFYTAKSKKGKKRSEEPTVTQNVENPTSESNQEISQTLNKDEAHSSAGMLVAAISAAGLANMSHESHPETHSTPMDAPVSSTIQAGQSPDGLAAGYKEEQLALARKLQEEFGSGSSKKSKKGKKKAQSATQTPDVSTPLREEGVSYFDDDQDRGRGFEDSKRAEDSKPIDSLDTGYKNEQLELARQLQAEFGSESKKSKDKKKSRSTSWPPTGDLTSREAEKQSSAGEPITDPALNKNQPKVDGLEAGYKEEQLQLARELQASFGPGSKRKKDKKSQSTSQTPTQDLEPDHPTFDESQQASTPKDVEPDSAKPASEDTPSGYNEEQPILAKQLKEEFGNKSKPSKKDKKRQSLPRFSTSDYPTSRDAGDAAGETSQNSGPSTTYGETSDVVAGSNATESEEGLASSKKSKKDKKKRRSQLQSETALSDVLPSLEQADLPTDTETKQGIGAAEPEEEPPSTSKKSKKEKKKRQSQSEPELTPEQITEVVPSLEPTGLSGNSEIKQEILTESGNESKKSKKDKIERQGADQSESPPEYRDDLTIKSADHPAENAEREVSINPIVAEPLDELPSTSQKSTKKSKKDNKKRQSQVEPRFPGDESADAIPEPLVQSTEEISAEKFEAPNSSAETNLLVDKFTPEQLVDTAVLDPVEEDSYSTKKTKKDKKKRKSQLQSSPVGETSLATEKPSGEDSKTSYGDIPAQDDDLQKLEDDLNMHTVPTLEAEPVARGLNEDVAVDDDKVQPSEDKLELEPPVHGVAGSLPTEAETDKDPEVQKIEADLNLGKATEGKKSPQRTPLLTSEDNALSLAVPRETAVPEFVPETEPKRISQYLLDAEEALDSISKAVEVDNGEESSSLTSKRSKKDKKNGKDESQKASEDKLQKDTSRSHPDEENANSTPAEFIEPTESPTQELKVHAGTTISQSLPSIKHTEADTEAVTTLTPEEQAPLTLTEAANQPDMSAFRSKDLEQGLAAIASADALANFDEKDVAGGKSASILALESSSLPDAGKNASVTTSEPCLPLKPEIASQQLSADGTNSETPTKPEVPPETEPAHQLDHNTSRLIEKNETAVSEPMPQPPTPEDEFVFTSKQSKKDRKKKKRLDLTETSDTASASTPAEPSTDLIQDNNNNNNVPETIPVIESLEDDSFSTSGKKSKKDKKKKRASVMFEDPNIETTIGSPTPAKQVLEPNSIEGAASGQPVVESIEQPILELADDDPGFSPKKSKKDKKKRASMAANSQADDAQTFSTPVETVAELSTRANTEDTKPVSEPTKDSSNDPVQPVAEPIQKNLSLVAGKESNEEKETTKNSVPLEPEENNVISVPSPSESVVQTHNLDTIAAPLPLVEPFDTSSGQLISESIDDNFTLPSTKKSKKDKKKKRTSTTLDPQDNDSTPGISTPIEPLVEPEVQENNETQLGVDSPKDDSPNSNPSVEPAVETGNPENVQDQPSLEPSKHSISIPEPVVESSTARDMRSLPTEELAKDEIFTPAKPSRLDVLLSQSMEQPIGDENSTLAKSNKLDNLLSQIVPEPTTSDSLIPPEPRKPDDNSRPFVENPSTFLDPTLDFDRPEDQIGRPSTESAYEPVPSTGKKSKKDKKKRKSGSNQQSGTDHTGTSTPAEQEPSNAEDHHSFSTGKQAKDESPASVEPLNVQGTSIQLPTQATEDEFGFATKKSKKDKKKRKSGLGQLQDANLGEPSTPVEPVANSALREQLISEEILEPVADPTLQREINARKSGEIADLAVQKESIFEKPVEPVAGSTIQEQSIPKVSAGQFIQSTVPEGIISSTTVEPKTESVTLEQSVTSQPNAEVAAPEGDGFEVSTGTKSKKDKKRRSTVSSQQESTDNTGTLTTVEPAIQPPIQGETTQQGTEITAHEEDEVGSRMSKKSKKDKRKKGALDLPNDVDIPSSPTTARQTADSQPGQENVADPTAWEIGMKETVEDEWGLSSSKKSKQDKKKKKGVSETSDEANAKGNLTPADAPAASDQELPPLHSIVEAQHNSETAEPTAATDLDTNLSIAANIEHEKLYTSQADLDAKVKEAADDEWGSIPSKKSKKDKKKRKGTLDPAENTESFTSTSSSAPDPSKEVSLEVTNPGTSDQKDDVGRSAEKKSKETVEKQKAFDIPEEPDATGTHIPTAEAHSKLDQVNPDDGKPTSPEDLKLSTGEDNVSEHSIPGEPSNEALGTTTLIGSTLRELPVAAGFQEPGEQPITLRPSMEIGDQLDREKLRQASTSPVSPVKPSKDKKRNSLLAAGPSTPNDSTPEPETTLSSANENSPSKELQGSPAGSGNAELPSESPEAGSDFGSFSRKSSKKSKKRGKSEVDLAAAKVVNDDMAASSKESGKVNASQSTIEDTSAPPLKRSHFELSGDPEPDLATPDAEGVNPLLREKPFGAKLSRIPEYTVDSTEQHEDKSRKLGGAAKLGASTGLGIVAGLAAKFEAPKADTTTKSSQGKKKDIDIHSSSHDDDFRNAPAETSSGEIPVIGATASDPIKSDYSNPAVAENDLATSRDIVDVPDSTKSFSEAGLKGSSSAQWNDDNSSGTTTPKKSEEKQSRVDQTETPADLDNYSELKIPETRSKNTGDHKGTSIPQLQDSSPPSPVIDLSPVIEESSRQIPSVHPQSQPPALDPNRDSTLVDESPIPPQRGFEHNYIRDSGVQLRDWSTSPTERKPEAVSDHALKRLSWPRVNDDAETIDLQRYQEPSIKAELDKHIDDIALGVAVATGAAAARQISPTREHVQVREHLRRTPSPRSLGLLEKCHRPQTPRSLGTVPRLHTPEQNRAASAASVRSLASNLSSTSPPLRRSDRQKNGDLRSLSQRSEASSVKDAETELRDSTENNKTTTTTGQVHTEDMADVYDGFGEGRLGSPISPTRPPSMRRRQSMKVLDLEAQLHQLAEENRMLSEGKTQAEQSLYTAQRAAATLADRDAEIDSLKQTIDWLHREVSRLTEVNEGLSSANITMGSQHDQRYDMLESQHNQTLRELNELRQSPGKLSTGMEGVVHHELESTLEEKNREIAQLYAELEEAKEQIRELQRQILAAKANDCDFLTVRDEDYLENACQQLCGYVQQWVLRFSKFSDMRACRLTSEISNEKIVNRLDNAVLDGSDVDEYLSDRVKRRDIFMSMTMMMVWEFVFTRYLFGMDREQRQKLKSLEKILAEVGPQAAVHQWRATTLTLLAKREAFLNQREQDTEAVVQEIFNTLSEILPPPSQLEDQIQEQLRKVMKVAVDLSIEMRTQRAEYMMLPPLQPEYDANGDLAHKFPFNAALMNERSGDTISNEELEKQGAIVRVVLFPLVVKKGDDRGEGDDEIVVCPAQVLVAKEHKRRSSSGRNVSGAGHSGVMGGHNASKMSIQSSMPAVSVMSRDGSPF